MSGCYEYGNEPERALKDMKVPSATGQLSARILPFLRCSLKKDAADSFETSVNLHLITQLNDPDDSDIDKATDARTSNPDYGRFHYRTVRAVFDTCLLCLVSYSLSTERKSSLTEVTAAIRT